MSQDNFGEAQIKQIKRWSPVWIVPIITVLIGTWIIYYHFSHQGPQVILTTANAEGIVPGKTAIKSRSVDIGVVESAKLSRDLHHVEIRARLNTGTENMLHSDSVFWTVKPQVGRAGITGLGTLLSGSYIELQAGTKGEEAEEYALLDSPPLATPDAQGIHITLNSSEAGQLTPGDPVLFRGYRVGSVELSQFNADQRQMQYKLFIQAPYDRLVTSNARFWKDSGVAVDLSASGMRVEMGSIATLFGGGVSFDVPKDWDLGTPAANKAEYHLYNDQRSINDSLYTQHADYLLFFNESIRGLQAGAPVEFRGIRLGTVAQVPYIIPGMLKNLNGDYRIPVLIRIEPERFSKKLGNDFDLEQRLNNGIVHGLHGSLKSANLLTGALYIDLDFNRDAAAYKGPAEVGQLKVIPTVDGGLAQMQQKVMSILDKFDKLPLNPLLTQATKTLQESQATMQRLQVTLDHVNQLANSPEMKNLPADVQQTLREVNRSMQGLQPGSPLYNKLNGNLQRLDQVLSQLQPMLRTLNNKSNALVFEAKPAPDVQPKKAKQ